MADTQWEAFAERVQRWHLLLGYELLMGRLILLADGFVFKIKIQATSLLMENSRSDETVRS